MELLKSLRLPGENQPPQLLHMLDSQIAAITAKARMIQKGLYCLLLAIAAFLLCSLLAGASVLHDLLGFVAVGMHFFGLAIFLAGISWAMRELALSITPLEEESAYLDAEVAYHVAKSRIESRTQAFGDSVER